MKKTVIGATVLIVLSGIGLAGYWLFLRNEEAQEETNSPEGRILYRGAAGSHSMTIRPLQEFRSRLGVNMQSNEG
jgi:hypothetical protein